MPVIKRYPNRKLYDTEAKQYITLDKIAEMVRQGEDVQVIDNQTGVDLTAVTLSQVVFEQEKKKTGFLPRSVLTNLIQSSGDRLSALQRSFLTSIRFQNLVDHEIRRRFQALVDQGELTGEQAQEWVDKLLAQATPDEELPPLHERLASLPPELEAQILARLQIPTRTDIQSLVDQLDSLEQKINQIQQNGA